MNGMLPSGAAPKRRGVITKAGVGKFVGVSKNPGGADEEWTYSFNDCGAVMVKTLDSGFA